MATATLLSFEEFERLEWGADKLELVKGALTRMPPAAYDHMMVCKRLFKQLDAAVDKLRVENPSIELGEVLIESGYRFATQAPSWLVPDVSLSRPKQPVARYMLGAPLIAFEVVSDSQTAGELDEKVAEYLANGAAEVWLLYPKKRHAWVFEASNTARLESQAIRTPLLPGVEILLAGILAPA